MSLRIHEGASVVEVARDAGHAPSMAADTYAHVIAEFDPDRRRSAAAEIEAARKLRCTQGVLAAVQRPAPETENPA